MTDHRPSDPIHAEAIGWVVRVNDPAFGDWDEFTQWLDANPAHADAYHAAATAEADAVALLASAPSEIEARQIVEMPSRPRWRPWVGTAIAASLVAVIGFQVMDRTPAPQIYETAPGIRRTISLADGSVVILNGGTRLAVDGKDPRSLTLERGEGLFAVRHDASHPFRVAVGGATVTDIGTAFDIVREPASTRVTVAEGEVEWGRNGNAVRLLPGDRLAVADNAVTVEISKVMPDSVGDWSRGQLTFDGTPLASAAADLGRTLGVTIDVAPSIAKRPVRGAIRLDGGAAAVLPRFAALMGLHARQDGQGWRLTTSP
ncbi:FecR family protein [Sphingomonas sp. MMS24-J13]|uniref:FecR family protein n=1 Tax=Sphingomonas sp. MMS24-J13 TaxID=3238686 RepID=UPI00384B1E1D